MAKPAELLEYYWRQCEARGDKPTPVFAIIERGVDTDNPAGTIKNWFLRKREATLAWQYPRLQRLVKITVE